MIRPFTFLCMVGALGSGLYLYQCKHQAQVLDREIARTIKQTEAARDRIGMLRAEWTQLNQPERVSDLARAHTSLQTAKPTQFVSAGELASRLPAPVALPPPAPLLPTDVTPEEAPVAQAEPPPAALEKPAAKPAPVAEAPARSAEPPRVAEARRPDSKSEAKPVRPAALVPAPTTATISAPTAAIARSPLPAPIRIPVRHAADAPAATVSVLRAPASREPAPVPAYVQHVAAPTYAAPAYTAPAYVAPVYVAPAAAAPAGSVLGGSRGLPPPVPFAAR